MFPNNFNTSIFYSSFGHNPNNNTQNYMHSYNNFMYHPIFPQIQPQFFLPGVEVSQQQISNDLSPFFHFNNSPPNIAHPPNLNTNTPQIKSN
jgi:hypothetical protein